ncbi:hypothetical protein ACOSP7_013052 [Xanthoceras sorbifolium]
MTTTTTNTTALKSYLSCPCQMHEMFTNQFNLAVQLNYFDCGDVAVSLTFKHAVANGAAAAHFVKKWATVACGGNDINELVIFCSQLYPPFYRQFWLIDYKQ